MQIYLLILCNGKRDFSYSIHRAEFNERQRISIDPKYGLILIMGATRRLPACSCCSCVFIRESKKKFKYSWIGSANAGSSLDFLFGGPRIKIHSRMSHTGYIDDANQSKFKHSHAAVQTATEASLETLLHVVAPQLPVSDVLN